MRVFLADYVVLGGGGASNIKHLPAGARLGHNLTAFRGRVRIWEQESQWTLAMPAAGPDSVQSANHNIMVEEPFIATKSKRHLIRHT